MSAVPLTANAWADRALSLWPDLRTECYIGGTWEPGGSGRTFAVCDPATGEAVAEVADGTVNDMSRAVEAAAGAFGPWSASAPRTRSDALLVAHRLMADRSEALSALVSLESGKALVDARAEVLYAAEFLRWYAEEAVRASGEVSTAPSGRNKVLVIRQPVGVSLLVTPWNFPAAMVARKVGPALAAGCTVVCKPAQETPLTALAIARILEEAGVPAGVVNVVPTTHSSDLVPAALAMPAVRKLSFTGSTEVGRLLLARAAHRVVNCSMELGGNAPFVVFEDADLEGAVQGALVAKMRNGGAACTAANRFYVQAGIAREFSERLAEAMSCLRTGPGLDPASQVGAMINERALRKVDGLVGQALDQGGTVLAGGSRLGEVGSFYAPTVVCGLGPGAPVLREEIFGPVAPIVTFLDEVEAAAYANGGEYGLVAYVYTRDVGRGLRFAESLQTGMVGLNQGIVSEPAAPFGGVKQSGIGREGAHEGLLEYLEPKYVACNW